MHYKIILTIIYTAVFVYGCSFSGSENQNDSAKDNTEASEDSLQLSQSYQLQAGIKYEVNPVKETVPVTDNPLEDAADDPAIWLNRRNPDQSLIFGTNKKNGINAYDLDGKQVAFYPLGKINNIDVRQNVTIGRVSYDIIGGSNRSDNSIVLYSIDSLGRLQNLLKQNHMIDSADLNEVYGFCLYRDEFHQAHVFINGKNGKINQYFLIPGDDQSGELEFLNSWQLDSQPEGMVADDQLAYLYIGEEENGIWKLSINAPDLVPTLIFDSQKENNPDIEYDIEGLAIYFGEEDHGFLIASIQGSFSYALFDRFDNSYLGSFKITEHHGIDGVEETDGLDIHSRSIGTKYPGGILVVQDGFNYDNSEMHGQNFKYIQLDDVLKIVKDLRQMP